MKVSNNILNNATGCVSGCCSGHQRAALGNITNFAAKVPETRNTYVTRFKLLKVSQLNSYTEKDGKRDPNRVVSCMKVPAYGNTDYKVDVVKADGGSVSQKGVGVCGSVWTCPVCSGNIAYSRSREIFLAMQQNAKQGGQTTFNSFTVPHELGESLDTVMTRLKKSWSKLMADGSYKRLLKRYNYRGLIRAFEATFGQNGWHPHIHCICMFSDISVLRNIRQFEQELYRLWEKAVKKTSGKQINHHGLDVRLPRKGDSDEIAKYVTKFAYELTFSHKKLGKNGTSLTPFQILNMLEYKWTLSLAKLWREWVEVTEGMQQIRWSKGLKAEFNIEELTDEEVTKNPEGETVCTLTWQEYRAMYFSGVYGEFLDICASYDQRIIYYIKESILIRIKDRERDDIKRRNALKKYLRSEMDNYLESMSIL